jgi:glycosyltransferase involved in cell wall biosynthesis
VTNDAKPVDILFIEKSVGVSGSTMSLCTLLEHIDTERYTPHVVFSREEQLAYVHRRLGSIDAVRVTELGAPSGFQRLTQWLERRARHAGRALRRLQGAVGVFLSTLPYAIRLYGVARTRNVRLVHHNNGFDLGALVAARLLRVPLIAFQRGEEWNSFLVRLFAPRVDHYVANSFTTKDGLVRLGVPESRVSVAYPPIDLTAFDPARSSSLSRQDIGVDTSVPCFGIIGLLAEWKGHPIFLQAACDVFASIPAAQAFIVGATHSENPWYRDELERIASDLGIRDRVRFLGFRDDVPEILRLLDVVVHASVSPEPFGRVIVEAMAMKKPVIASNAGGPAEIIEHGRTGILVPPGDSHALAEEIVRLLREPHRARQLGEAAYDSVRSRFSLSAHVRQVDDIYVRTLNSHVRSRARLQAVLRP